MKFHHLLIAFICVKISLLTGENIINMYRHTRTTQRSLSQTSKKGNHKNINISTSFHKLLFSIFKSKCIPDKHPMKKTFTLGFKQRKQETFFP